MKIDVKFCLSSLSYLFSPPSYPSYLSFPYLECSLLYVIHRQCQIFSPQPPLQLSRYKDLHWVLTQRTGCWLCSQRVEVAAVTSSSAVVVAVAAAGTSIQH
jgi:hypothetical protein